MFGRLAQLGERRNGIAEVRGSSPLPSTINVGQGVSFARYFYFRGKVCCL